MRALTFEEIEVLASRKNVKRIAVENFLMSMGDDEDIAKMNALLDNNGYRWNSETLVAILEGINIAETEMNDNGNQEA